MNIGKLKRVAIKEFTRSPAKTGFLVVMIPVALYFCVPLLLGASKKTPNAISADAVVDGSPSAGFVLPVGANSERAKGRKRIGWVEVSRWLENDALAMPATVPSDRRDPFARVKTEDDDRSLAGIGDDEQIDQEDIGEIEGQDVESTVASSNPIRELGLQLNATMVGRRSKLATINGKTYEEGESIPVIIDSGFESEEMVTMQLALTDVDRRFVVLKMGTHEHRLQLRSEIPKDAIVVKPRRE